MRLVTFLARRYVAGDNWKDAAKAIAKMNAHGLYATCDMLGENVMKKHKAVQASKRYVHLLEQIDYRQLQANISVKLTQLGLDISMDFCKENLEKILKKARSLGNFVWIDMENSAYTDRTIEVYKSFIHKYGPQVGICIQSYLRRSEDDINNLLSPKFCVRLVKGAYKERKELAFAKKSDTDENFKHLIDVVLQSESKLLMVATHDEKILNYTKKRVKELKANRKRLEFGLLYGVKREVQRQLTKHGFRVRVYTPFGRKWIPYFFRRLRERRENFWFGFKSLFQR